MGNANVVEAGGENAAQDRGARLGGPGGNVPGGFNSEMSSDSRRIARPASLDSIGSSALRNPRRSRPPILSMPPEPVPPLNSSSEHQCPNHPWTDDPYESMDLIQDQGIPVLITWSFGGNEVVVQGSWDNWTSRKPLISTGKDHVILLVLPSGLYQYKFIVDGEWRYIPDLPCVPDDMGCVNNLLEVQEYVPESIGNVKEFEAPPSPDSSYNRPFQVVEDYTKEPPLEPPHIEVTVLGMQEAPGVPLRPHHVILNHLFIEKDVDTQSLVAFGLTHRFREKYVNVVLYKPARRICYNLSFWRQIGQSEVVYCEHLDKVKSVKANS
ncbi:SNF1-related protein kinase regulatory subunit beta-1-like isoform X2 [Nymphaea colorata]|uniref:SNF1-related protein kinase regulatory subunit beta-1-like isoform X2 n=1 Tax=Nymphaea colorata TaxID=210225 RepID=UPI00129E11EA|nr:SNF1-related protein kinase regulatory subunit beta-1-like isoform X2 [Nymphaea colorata]